MKRDEIGVRIERIETAQFNFQIACELLRDERIVGKNFHAERLRATRNFDSYAAESDDPQCFAFQLGPLHRLLLPFACAGGLVRFGNEASQRNHESDGVFSDRNCIRAGCVHYHDAFAGGSVGIDVVHTNSGASDDAQLLRRLDQLGVYIGCRAHDKRVGVPDSGCQIAHLLVSDNFEIRLVAEDLERCRRNFFSYKDFHEDLGM